MKKVLIVLALWMVFGIEPYSPPKYYHLRSILSEQKREKSISPFMSMSTSLTMSLPPAQLETVGLGNANSHMLGKKSHPSGSHKSLPLSHNNGSSLVPDEHYFLDIALNNSEIRVDMCSDVFKDPYYKKLKNRYMKAWHRFVPKQSKMSSANCWYHSKINKLPYSIAERMKQLDDLHSFEEKFSVKRALNMTSFSAFEGAKHISNHSHFCIPNIYIVGFHKSGTTLLYEYIKRHPLFAAPHTKESAFWRSIVSRKFDSKTLELAVLTYLYHFFNATIKMRDTPDMFTIDASASTVFATAKPLREAKKDVCFVPLLMAETMPKTKILVSMRNPIDRLWSGYLYFCPLRKWKNSTRNQQNFLQIVASTFHHQVLDAMNKFHNCIHKNRSLFHCTAIIGSYSSFDIECKRVRLGIGMYYVHLVKWFSVFPREQIHIIKYDDFAANPSSTVDQVFEFLSIQHDLKYEAIQENVKSNGWEKGFKMLPKTRKLLAKFYHPYNVKLSEFMEDKDFLWDE